MHRRAKQNFEKQVQQLEQELARLGGLSVHLEAQKQALVSPLLAGLAVVHRPVLLSHANVRVLLICASAMIKMTAWLFTGFFVQAPVGNHWHCTCVCVCVCVCVCACVYVCVCVRVLNADQ